MCISQQMTGSSIPCHGICASNTYDNLFVYDDESISVNSIVNKTYVMVNPIKQ